MLRVDLYVCLLFLGFLPRGHHVLFSLTKKLADWIGLCDPSVVATRVSQGSNSVPPPHAPQVIRFHARVRSQPFLSASAALDFPEVCCVFASPGHEI